MLQPPLIKARSIHIVYILVSIHMYMGIQCRHGGGNNGHVCVAMYIPMARAP